MADDRVLWGTALTDAAYRIAQRLDPGRNGLETDTIERALEGDGFSIRGEEPGRVLDSAMNSDQYRFRRTGRRTWTWQPEEGKYPTAGVSGKDLDDAAYSAAKSMTDSNGTFHYEDLKARLLHDGVRIKGRNPGQTLLRVIGKSSRFESVKPRSGIYRWK